MPGCYAEVNMAVEHFRSGSRFVFFRVNCRVQLKVKIMRKTSPSFGGNVRPSF